MIPQIAQTIGIVVSASFAKNHICAKFNLMTITNYEGHVQLLLIVLSFYEIGKTVNNNPRKIGLGTKPCQLGGIERTFLLQVLDFITVQSSGAMEPSATNVNVLRNGICR